MSGKINYEMEGFVLTLSEKVQSIMETKAGHEEDEEAVYECLQILPSRNISHAHRPTIPTVSVKTGHQWGRTRKELERPKELLLGPLSSKADKQSNYWCYHCNECSHGTWPFLSTSGSLPAILSHSKSAFPVRKNPIPNSTALHCHPWDQKEIKKHLGMTDQHPRKSTAPPLLAGIHFPERPWSWAYLGLYIGSPLL